jgi:GT2 family glycosyltransferase
MEEIDLCWRMQRAGYHVAVVPASTVWHIGGGTLPPTSPRKLYLNYRNNLLMLHNNLPKRGRLLTRMVLDGLSAAVYLFTGQWRNLAAVWRAHRDFRRLKGQDGHTLIPCTARYTRPVWPSTDRWIIPMAVVNTEKTFNFVHSL